MTATKKLDEVALFNQWKQTGDKVHFQALYESLKPMIDTAATKASYGSNLPQSAHRIYAAQNMYDALKTYDPSKGALQTHIYNAVHQKAKRLNYLYQNLGKITEPRAMMIGTYNNELANAKEELGREPSAAEMADRTGKSLKDIELIQKEIQKDLSSAGLEEEIITEDPRELEVLSYLYFELTNDQKVVYDYIFGKHGKPRMVKANNKIDFDGIATRSGFSASKVRMLHSQIKAKFDKAAR